MSYTIIEVTRDYRSNQTIGEMVIYTDGVEVFRCKSLELPWRNNQRNVSCIPAGTYDAVKEWSNKFKTFLIEFKNVPERSECKIHNANYTRQLNGCVAVGEKFFDLDGDGLVDVTNSRNTLKKIMAITPDKMRIKFV